MGIRDSFVNFIHDLQDAICAEFEAVDGGKFVEDHWERDGGGGGKTRVLTGDRVIEKGGVNTSVVHGELPAIMRERFGVQEAQFFACGLSLVIHPLSPHIPTVHANYRYFELTNSLGKLVDAWFGGGTDLTPYYLVKEDATHFHEVLKKACDKFDAALYPRFKAECDDYFYNTHRGERRGIGGVFFDYLRSADATPMKFWKTFAETMGKSFVPAYLPIMRKRMHQNWTDKEKHWQEVRRGRYVEFNLIHDRGTLFGLKTNGRTESILMSLPATARWEYNQQPAAGTPESKLLEVLKNPISWTSRSYP